MRLFGIGHPPFFKKEKAHGPFKMVHQIRFTPLSGFWPRGGLPCRLPGKGPAGYVPKLSAPPGSVDQLPLFFILNQGQIDPQVEYYMHAGDKVFYFTSHCVTIVLKEPRVSAEDRLQAAAAIDRQEKARYWAAQLEFLGANQGVVPRGSRSLPTRISYFKGPPEQWRSAISRPMPRLFTKGSGRGVDLVFTTDNGQLEYTFLVRPRCRSGADTAGIPRGAKINATWHGTAQGGDAFRGVL